MILLFMVLFGGSFLPSELFGQVKLKEETVVIPTYKNEPPNPMPRFYEGRGASEARLIAEYFISGLGNKGLGNKEKTREQLNEVLKLNPSHLWSRIHLNSL